MTYPVSDDFDDRRGRWTQRAPWDDTMFVEFASGTADDFLATQEHVDLRSFRAASDLLAVPQYPDLDTVPQDPWLDLVFQTDLEVKPGDTFSEDWVTDTYGGINQKVVGQWDLTATYAANDIVEYKGHHYFSIAGANQGNNPTDGAFWTPTFFVGKIAARGGWHGLQVTTTGAALSATLRSSIPGDDVDISDQTSLSVVFPDWNSFTAGSSTVRLTSHPAGTFADSAYNSATRLFSSNTAAMPELRLALSGFASGAGASFSLSSVTGVEIVIVGAPGAAQTITVMAVRAVKTAWVPSWLDFDTRWGVVKQTPTLTGSVYAGTVAQDFEFIRGDGTPLDPFPVDGAYTLLFYGGGETSPTDQTGGNPNRLAIILRETKDAAGPNDGSAVLARLIWHDTELRFEAQRRDTDNGVTTTTTLFSEVINGTGLDPASLHAWTVKLVGKSLDSSVNVVNRSGEVQNTVWTLATVSQDNWTFRNGRVGFMADLANRDAYVDALVQAPVGYAILRSRVYESRNPADGARLQAIYSPDANLFSDLTGGDAFRDQTKTVSGDGAIRTLAGLETNQFIVDDWYETYLEAYIWVTGAVTLANQPLITLDSGVTDHPLAVPPLQPSQWNRVRFELRPFADLVTGLPYSFAFVPGRFPDTPLGYFWVDSVRIGRRKVAWSVRAAENGPFRRFFNLVNDPGGAVHFNPDERGRALQIQAEALTNDAWVSEFSLFPHYAELGLPLYDQAFEKRL
jgi:hypothetical protein